MPTRSPASIGSLAGSSTGGSEATWFPGGISNVGPCLCGTIHEYCGYIAACAPRRNVLSVSFRASVCAGRQQPARKRHFVMMPLTGEPVSRLAVVESTLTYEHGLYWP